jgi:16S rRNA pseudouridine516 synthase
MRLDKFLANNSTYSRAEVKIMLRSGRVRIDGVIFKGPAKEQVNSSQTISIDKKTLQVHGLLYMALNKPPGFVSARSDHNQPTVLDIINDQENFIGDIESFEVLTNSDLQIVGRLDKDTSGLLLITNDGQWNHRLCSPSNHCAKTYLVTLSEPHDESYIEEFQKGMRLKDDENPTLAAKIELIGTHQARVTIHEGRYHQVKRMFAAQGNNVESLHRESIAKLHLDPNLPEGKFRHLSPLELELLA